MKSLTIGKLAKAAAVGLETIRYYERSGLLEQPPRQEFGYRQYPEASIQRIRFIKNGKKIGFTLKEIKSVLDLIDGREMNCAHADTLLELKVAEIDQKIKAMHQMRQLLVKLRKSVGRCGEKKEMDFLSGFLWSK